MWKRVDPGEIIEADLGTGFLLYRADFTEDDRIGLTRADQRPDNSLYPVPRDGQTVKLRWGDDRFSSAVVLGVSTRMILLGPSA